MQNGKARGYFPWSHLSPKIEARRLFAPAVRTGLWETLELVLTLDTAGLIPGFLLFCATLPDEQDH
jgi:hypothetical protein